MSNNIVKHSQLHDIAGDLWTKAKKRGITALAYEADTKTIKGTNDSDQTFSASAILSNLASVDERTSFKKDVSVDNAKIVSNKNIGQLNGPIIANTRTTGYRSLSSASFTDKYIKTLRIYAPDNGAERANFHIWTIKKGETKAQDRLLEDKKVSTATIVTGDGVKYYDIPIEKQYADDVFFVVRTDAAGANIKGINQLKAGMADDVINLNDLFNPSGANTLVNWSAYDPTHELAGHMELHGRIGIVDLSKRLDEINIASGNYVLQSETTTTSEANKVVKLGGDGKINPNMIPEIAINRVLTATSKENALTMIGDGENKLQVGDVVVLSGAGNAAYMYKGRPAGGTDDQFDRDFLELTLGTGTIKNINGVTPNAQGSIVMTKKTTNTNTISLSFGTGGTDVELFSYMSDQEVEDIKALFR